jgi:hypothetical protein
MSPHELAIRQYVGRAGMTSWHGKTSFGEERSL